jgi:HD-GYP domain-containing protein (c-di-GMP phosphodiesterase class II)
MSHPGDDSESGLVSSEAAGSPANRLPAAVFIRSGSDSDRRTEASGRLAGSDPRAPGRSERSGLSSQYKIRLAVSELKIGMFVCELDRPWLESPFGFQGFPLRCVEDIQAVKRVCAYVYVDTEKSLGGTIRRREAASSNRADTQITGSTAPGAARKHAPRWLPAALAGRGARRVSSALAIHSLEIAHRAYDETSQQVRSVLRDLRWGRSIDARSTREAVAACADQVTRDPPAMVLLASIKDKDHYTAQHSLNVAILSMVLGHHLGLPDRTLTELGTAGLLHDVGKVLIPVEILKKPGRLTSAEFSIVRMHPAHGKEILEACGEIGRTVLEVAYTHHERLDGSGYPRGMKESEMGLLTRIVAITDTYEAVTSDRVYAQAKTSIEAFKLLQSASGNHYDGQLVSELIGAVGLFPPGSTVQLNNGKYAVVVRTNPRYEFRPTVLVLKDAKCRPIKPRYIDLADIAGGASASFQIARLVKPSDCGIDSSMFRNQEFLQETVS